LTSALHLPASVKSVLIASVLLLTAGTFSLFPGGQPFYEGWNVWCVLYLFFLYPWLRSARHQKASMFEYYMIALMIIVPFWMAFSARDEFGQPLIYGLLALRNLAVISGLLYLSRALRNKTIALEDVEKSFVVLFWGLWFLYLFMRLGLNPALFATYKKGFVSPSVGGAPAQFLLQPDYLIVGAFYYVFRGFRNQRARDYILGLVLLAGSLGQTGRTTIVGFFATFLLLVFRWGRAKRVLLFLPKLFVGLALVCATLFLVIPQEATNRIEMLGDAFTVVFTGKATNDSSANTHFIEALYAIPAIAKHPILGNGRLSNQWEGGAENVRGVLFYPDDVAILGVLYECGVAGLLVFGIQFWFALRAARKIPFPVSSPLFDAAKGILLFSALPFTNGMYVFEVPFTLVFVLLLRAGAAERSIPEETGGKLQSFYRLFVHRAPRSPASETASELSSGSSNA